MCQILHVYHFISSSGQPSRHLFQYCNNCYRSNCALPPKAYGNPNLQPLRTGFYLEIVLLQIWVIRQSHTGVGWSVA